MLGLEHFSSKSLLLNLNLPKLHTQVLDLFTRRKLLLFSGVGHALDVLLCAFYFHFQVNGAVAYGSLLLSRVQFFAVYVRFQLLLCPFELKPGFSFEVVQFASLRLEFLPSQLKLELPFLKLLFFLGQSLFSGAHVCLPARQLALLLR